MDSIDGRSYRADAIGSLPVSAQRPILNPDKKLVYHYDLQVYYVDGGMTPYYDKTSSFEIIYVP